MVLHENITRRRVALGLSRKQVAERLGITERQWWRLETDRIHLLAAEMPQVAQVLKTTVAILYREPRQAVRTTDVTLASRRCPQRGRRQGPKALEACR